MSEKPTVDAAPTATARMVDTVRAAGTLDLTVHRIDPDAKAVTRCPDRVDARYRVGGGQREYDGHWGKTRCGKALSYAELWVRYEPEERDDLCRRCFA